MRMLNVLAGLKVSFPCRLECARKHKTIFCDLGSELVLYSKVVIGGVSDAGGDFERNYMI
jgi:hypothetical protein